MLGEGGNAPCPARLPLAQHWERGQGVRARMAQPGKCPPAVERFAVSAYRALPHRRPPSTRGQHRKGERRMRVPATLILTSLILSAAAAAPRPNTQRG